MLKPTQCRGEALDVTCVLDEVFVLEQRPHQLERLRHAQKLCRRQPVVHRDVVARQQRPLVAYGAVKGAKEAQDVRLHQRRMRALEVTVVQHRGSEHRREGTRAPRPRGGAAEVLVLVGLQAVRRAVDGVALGRIEQIAPLRELLPPRRARASLPAVIVAAAVTP